jgi:hypothetical protein
LYASVCNDTRTAAPMAAPTGPAPSMLLSIMEAPTGHTSICLCKWFGVDAPKPRTLVKAGGCFYVRS